MCVPCFAAVRFACVSERVVRLRQAQEEAEKTIAALREQHHKSLAAEFAQKDQGDAGFAAELKRKVEEEQKAIEEGYAKHSASVADLLLRHVTTVELSISEALRQSLLTKAETGNQ